ncbi:MAG: hypothetical protein ACYS6W_15930, partial [Planctomycetota bacterium]
EAGEKGILLDMKRYKMHKSDKKMAQKVLYKHINSWIPAPCLRLAGAGYNMQGFGQVWGRFYSKN